MLYEVITLGDKALPLVRIVAPDGNYDYQNKYFTDVTRYDCPCGLPAEQEAELQAMVMKSAQVLGCRGWGRGDFILTEDQRPYLLEMNTSPGMTGHSLVPRITSYNVCYTKLLRGPGHTATAAAG